MDEAGKQTATYKCRGECGKTYPYNPDEFKYAIGGTEMSFAPKTCSKCVEKREAKQAWLEQKRIDQERKDRWLKICDDEYMDTVVKELPAVAQKFLSEVMKWEYGPIGMLFIGTSGKGKSRLMHLLLEKLHFAGLGIEIWDSTDFVNTCAFEFQTGPGRGKMWVDRMIRVPILVTDDIGNQPHGERGEGELFHILKRRTDKRKPYFATSNLSSQGLTAALSVKGKYRGPSIVRRLDERCVIYNFDTGEIITPRRLKCQ